MKAFVIAGDRPMRRRSSCRGAHARRRAFLLVTIGTDPATGVADKAFAVELPQASSWRTLIRRK